MSDADPSQPEPRAAPSGQTEEAWLIDPLICEGCGYSLEGATDQSAVCPECGRPVAKSLPSARPGSPWQIKPSAVSYLWTVWLVLASPRRVWEGVRVGEARAASLLGVSLGFQGVGGSILILAGIASPSYIAIFAIYFTAILIILTFTEIGGLYVFGRRRGFRMKGYVPIVIGAHAASAWWISVLGMVVVTRVSRLVRSANGPGSAWLEGDTAIFWTVSVPNTAVLEGAAFIAGMVSYSLLAGAGFHALRFVNRPAGRGS